MNRVNRVIVDLFVFVVEVEQKQRRHRGQKCLQGVVVVERYETVRLWWW